MERYPVSLAGVDLEVEGIYSKHPKFLRDGEPLPKDRWGSWVLVDGQSKSHHPGFGYSPFHWSLTVTLDERDQVVLWPLSRVARIALAVAWLGAVVGGGIVGVLLVGAGTWATLRVHRQPNRKALHSWMIAGVWLAVAAFYLLYSVMIHGLRT
ncbi:hypothetical protein [Kineosporia sp. NBRC 101731]|uniref:hypothetical protein n=1 Tax=Kineosporia sp. NBRC 101731 TaxID=3032199 RepID=UPI0024A53CE0|nr:hypothetical protein [Kineosporia sp. NBRC 101731]GLY32674.1 hypothetical protein Kisp02_60390 [Kineosporia sp. NBRC 101731]